MTSAISGNLVDIAAASLSAARLAHYVAHYLGLPILGLRVTLHPGRTDAEQDCEALILAAALGRSFAGGAHRRSRRRH